MAAGLNSVGSVYIHNTTKYNKSFTITPSPYFLSFLSLVCYLLNSGDRCPGLHYGQDSLVAVNVNFKGFTFLPSRRFQVCLFLTDVALLRDTSELAGTDCKTSILPLSPAADTKYPGASWEIYSQIKVVSQLVPQLRGDLLLAASRGERPWGRPFDCCLFRLRTCIHDRDIR